MGRHTEIFICLSSAPYIHCKNKEYKVQQNGILQVSILSVILFAIEINNINENITECYIWKYKYNREDDRMLASLFVNDFQIGYRHSALSVIGSKLQQFFTFQLDFPKSFYSTCKTSMFKFLDSSAPVALPDLFLGNNHLSYNSSARF